MAFPSSSSSSKLLVIFALALVLFVSPILGRNLASLNADGKQVKKVTKGFRATLKHVDADGNFTKLELLQRAMKRGRKREAKLNAMALAGSSPALKAPLHAGDGEFLVDLRIGTPSIPYTAIMDTGSDLIWTKCKPCRGRVCSRQSGPIFDRKKSSSFSSLPCHSSLCQALPKFIPPCGTDGSCQYQYMYGDGASTQGIMGRESFTFGDVTVAKIGFGCGEDNEGSDFDQSAGIVGLGRGPLSLVSQLDEPKFSYCLVTINNGDNDNSPSRSRSSSRTSSLLLLGSLATPNSINTTTNSSIGTTPLIVNPSQATFYYLSLEGITVGGSLLPIDKSAFALKSDGRGGMIIDSGTTLTFLETSAFDLVKKAFISRVNLPADTSGSTGLELCFKLPPGTTKIEVPSLTFHFEGADVEFPGNNFIIVDTRVGVACLAMGSSTGMSIFGNVFQQNFLMLHDLKKETLSFIPTQCSQL